MTLFCGLKNILGSPRAGFHATRTIFLDLAFWDLFGTLLIAWFLSKVMSWNIWKTIVWMFAFATFVHWIFCVDTEFIVFLKQIFN